MNHPSAADRGGRRGVGREHDNAPLGRLLSPMTPTTAGRVADSIDETLRSVLMDHLALLAVPVA